MTPVKLQPADPGRIVAEMIGVLTNIVWVGSTSLLPSGPLASWSATARARCLVPICPRFRIPRI